MMVCAEQNEHRPSHNVSQHRANLLANPRVAVCSEVVATEESTLFMFYCNALITLSDSVMQRNGLAILF